VNRSLPIAIAIGLALSGAALGKPPPHGGGGPPHGGGGPPPGGGGGPPHGGGGGPPHGGGGGHHPPPPPPHHHPPPPHHGPRPPGWRYPPNTWHAPRAGTWYWRGSWVRRIPGPAFFYPHGYAYRRWAAGMLLPAIFISSRYYYDAYATLGLPPPPPGYRWVRYGPDLLLVSITTGRVADVAYGVFL
jgi:hypothetical protein